MSDFFCLRSALPAPPLPSCFFHLLAHFSTLPCVFSKSPFSLFSVLTTHSFFSILTSSTRPQGQVSLMALSIPPNSISPPPRSLFHNPRIHSTLPGRQFLFPCSFSHPKSDFFSPSHVSFPPSRVGFLCSHPFPSSRLGFLTCRLIISPSPIRFFRLYLLTGRFPCPPSVGRFFSNLQVKIPSPHSATLPGECPT